MISNFVLTIFKIIINKIFYINKKKFKIKYFI